VASVLSVVVWSAFLVCVLLVLAGVRLSLGPFVLPSLLIMALSPTSRLLLWLWRTCDRCGFRLFGAGPVTAAGLLTHKGQARYPSHLAKRSLGSFRFGAVVAGAFEGGARCL
jgi:hypothetical protein